LRCFYFAGNKNYRDGKLINEISDFIRRKAADSQEISFYKSQYDKPYLDILKSYAKKITPLHKGIKYSERVWMF
jgi:predicted metal-dependent hydrolase